MRRREYNIEFYSEILKVSYHTEVVDAYEGIEYIEIGCDGVGWIQLEQDTVQYWALVTTVMNNRIP
jgi:hypothetical protein